MPTITKITVQKHQPDRYSIYADETYVFALSANELLSSGLYQGQELTQAEIDELSRSAGLGKAYDQALNFINMRLRSEYEVRRYLQAKAYEGAAINSTVERLIRNQFLDDYEFARVWVRDRQILKPRSRRLLEQELKQKGLNSAVIEQVLNEQSPDSEFEAALAIATKKLTRYPDQQKLTNYLMRQGFNYQLIKQVIEQLASR